MPRLIFIFLATILSITSMAQPISFEEAQDYANQLVERKVLNEKGRDLMLKQLAAKKIETEHRSTVNAITYTEDDLSKETILEFCARAFLTSQTYRLFKTPTIEQKIKTEDSLARKSWTISFPFGKSLGKDNGDFVPPTRSTIGWTRTRTLRDLHDIGFISDTVYRECEKALLSKEVKDEPELLRLMTERSLYYRYYSFNKEEQTAYINKLTELGLFAKSGRDSLLASYKPFELKSIPQILAYSPRYVMVDLTKVEAKPALTYPLIFTAVQKLLPEFTYTNLRTVITEEKESDLIRQDLQLSFAVDSNTYTHRYFHDYRKQKPLKTDPKLEGSKIDEDWHKGINKWLTDVESLFRLYTIALPEKGEGPYGKNRVGLLLLKQGEANSVTQNVYLLSQESFDNRLSKRGIEKLIAEFKMQGFFSHLTQKEMDSARKKVATVDISSIEAVLACFPRTIVGFDWESDNLKNPYEELTKRFATASRGALKISNIVDEYEKVWNRTKKVKHVKYGFTLNGKHYEAMLPFEGDWLAPEFMELLRRAMKENGVDGDIYHVIDDGQAGGYMFFTPSQFRFVKEKYPDLLKER